ncbi:MAG: M50 family metallopeptidase [Fimbriimonadaceae bacterium]|nr:M50 family metallopeptidase [Fimbriimonadaceae bacterium]
MPQNKAQRALLIASLLSAAGLVLPYANWLLLPVQYLNTHIHEFCHAFAAIATGGRVEDIHVYAAGNGETLLGGGWAVVIGSAGYVGATIFGGLMVAVSRTEKGARVMLQFLGVLLAISMALWVRGDWMGVGSGAFWVLTAIIVAAKAKDMALIVTAQFIGIQQCLSALQSLWVLLRINAYPGIENDAAILEKSTRIPAMAWAILWSVISLGVLWASFRQGWSGSSKAPGESPFADQ